MSQLFSSMDIGDLELPVRLVLSQALEGSLLSIETVFACEPQDIVFSTV